MANTNSSAEQALDVVTSSIADGQTATAWNDADTAEEIAGVFNAAQDVQNMDAARFTGQTDSEPALPDSPGGVDPGRDDLPAEEPTEDASPSDNTGGGDE
jgi:hypothetical protein